MAKPDLHSDSDINKLLNDRGCKPAQDSALNNHFCLSRHTIMDNENKLVMLEFDHNKRAIDA